VAVAPEELRHDQRAGPRLELRSRLAALPDVPVVVLHAGIGEKLSHAAALLSGGSARVRIERVEDDLVGHGGSYAATAPAPSSCSISASSCSMNETSFARRSRPSSPS